MRADIKQGLVGPTHIVSTQLRPDPVLWANLEKLVYYYCYFVAVRIKLRKPTSLTARYSETMQGKPARQERATEACGGRLLWFCYKICWFSTQQVGY